MKRSTTIVVLFIFILCCSTLTASAQTDEQRIKDVITSAYVNGIQNSGSLQDIDTGFHPCFELPAHCPLSLVLLKVCDRGLNIKPDQERHPVFEMAL